MRASKALEALLEDYVAYYEERWLQGKLTACNEKPITERVRRILAAAPRLSQELGGVTLHSIITTCVRKDNDHRGKLNSLIRAFEFLELVCVNMFLCPWRKEIKCLKTFTGRFVYSVQSVLPEEVLKGILQKIGYTTKTATEFLATEMIDEKEKQQFAFQIFLARMECQLILEMAIDAKTFNCLKFLNGRAETAANNDAKDEGTPFTVECPENVLNGDIQKITRGSDSVRDNPCLHSEAIADERVHFEMSTDGMIRTKQTHQSETTVNEIVICKGKYHMEPSSDGSNEAMHMPFSDELGKTNTTFISQSADHGNSGKELHHSNVSENPTIVNKGVNFMTLSENMDHKGHMFSQSLENSQITSRIMCLSEISGNQDSQGHDSSELDGKENGKSAEIGKMGIQRLNPLKCFDNMTTGKKELHHATSTKNMHRYMEELSDATSDEKATMSKNELISSEPMEDKKVACEDHYSFTFNAERNDGIAGKSHSRASADNQEYYGMLSCLQSTEDRQDSKAICNPESTVGKISNKGMPTSNLDPKIQVPYCESADRILDSTNQAAACFQSNRSESEEFLKQYSDLNIAQKPVLKEESPLQYKKLKINESRLDVDAAVLEESTTAEPKPLRLHESKPQTFKRGTEAIAKIGKPKKSEDIPEAYNFVPAKNFTLENSPPIAESSITKNETGSSFVNVPVAEHDTSEDEECELAASFSKLKISEHLEEHLAYQIEKTSNSEVAAFKMRSTTKGKQVHVAHSTLMSACSPQNIVEGDFSLPNSCPKITECTEGNQLESVSKPCMDTMDAGMLLDQYQQVREPPGCSYNPPDSLKNLPFDENCNSLYFKFLPEENNEKGSSTGTVAVGDLVFQVNEDLKEDFVVISHPMAPND